MSVNSQMFPPLAVETLYVCKNVGLSAKLAEDTNVGEAPAPWREIAAVCVEEMGVRGGRVGGALFSGVRCVKKTYNIGIVGFTLLPN